MKRSLAALLLLLLGAQLLSAQETVFVAPDDMSWTPRVLSLIDTVEVKAQEDKPVLLVYGTMPDGCERDTLIAKERQGTVLFVDVYHDPVPPSTVGCPKMLIPLALVVPLPEILTLDADATLPTILVVNDKIYRIDIAQVEPTSDAPAVPPITLTPLVRTSPNIDTVSVEEREDGVYLLVAGTYPEGCPDPAHSRVIRTSETTQDYTVDIFRGLDDPMMCPDTYVAVTYELAIKTPVEIGTPATFTVEGQRLAYTPDGQTAPTSEETVRVPHTIESVDVILLESYPVQIRLNVQGYQPDGCDVPVYIMQTREDTRVNVEIYRELPADAICTMIAKEFSTFISLEGGFTSGTYTIDVNGTVVEVKI